MTFKLTKDLIEASAIEQAEEFARSGLTVGIDMQKLYSAQMRDLAAQALAVDHAGALAYPNQTMLERLYTEASATEKLRDLTCHPVLNDQTLWQASEIARTVQRMTLAESAWEQARNSMLNSSIIRARDMLSISAKASEAALAMQAWDGFQRQAQQMSATLRNYEIVNSERLAFISSQLWHIQDHPISTVYERIMRTDLVGAKMSSIVLQDAERLNVIAAQFAGISRVGAYAAQNMRDLLDIRPGKEVLGRLQLVDAFYDDANVEREADAPTVEILADDDLPFGALLNTVNPDYARLWRGAKEALNSDNPDRARHVIVSLRELTTQILNTLAEDSEIRKWTSDKKHYHEGRPTREARLLFLCSPVNIDTFTEFVVEDVRSHIAFIRILNRATHKLVVDLSDAQLLALIAKGEGLIRFLISIQRTLH